MRDNLSTIYAKKMIKYEKDYPTTKFEVGDRVWVRNVPKTKNDKQVERMWSRLYEIMELMGPNRFQIHASHGAEILGIKHRKSAFPLPTGTKLRVERHTHTYPLSIIMTHGWLTTWLVTSLSRVPPVRGKQS